MQHAPIDQHVFRSPALIVADDHQTLILIPDLDIMQKGTPVRWYMDMDASSNTLILGMCNNHVFEHVLFERDQETTYPKGDIEIGFLKGFRNTSLLSEYIDVLLSETAKVPL